MLNLILGKAKTGKTALIMGEIKKCVSSETGNTVLLTPEQYSFEAERELLRVCGDSMCLYAEVLSFSRLAVRVEEELSIKSAELDSGGRFLLMNRTLKQLQGRLRVYKSSVRRPQLCAELLSTIDEFENCCISPELLRACPAERGLREKLEDLALIYETFRSLIYSAQLDPTPRLVRLKNNIKCSKYRNAALFLDGFIDFTAQQSEVLREFLSYGAEITISLACADLKESHEIYEPSRKAALSLIQIANECGCEYRIIQTERKSEPFDESGNISTSGLPLPEVVERTLFSFNPLHCKDDRIILNASGHLTAECEAAAARCLSLVRTSGCRFRDIAIAARDYNLYRGTLERVFSHYDIPLYSAAKVGLMERPLFAMIQSAFRIIDRGWVADDVCRYLKTGLTGLPLDACDALENYIYLWSVSGKLWTRETPWTLNPLGFAEEETDESRELLSNLDKWRRVISVPLQHLWESGKNCTTISEHVLSFYAFLEEAHVSPVIQSRCDALAMANCGSSVFNIEKADDAQIYSGMWEALVSTLEQFNGTIGDMPVTFSEFGELLEQVLAKYEIGTIPLMQDRVGAGDFSHMRRRNIKHLLVLGADSDHIPMVKTSSSILTEDERAILIERGLEIGYTSSERLNREFSMLYQCLTLPSDSLYISYTSSNGSSSTQPSFIFTRAESVFSVASTESLGTEKYRSLAVKPAKALAVRAAAGKGGITENAVLEWFTEHGMGEEIFRMARGSAELRGSLTIDGAKLLYGNTPILSASQIENYQKCHFGYFMQYGLNAGVKKRAEYGHREYGNFMHYTLQKVLQRLDEKGIIDTVSEDELNVICEEVSSEYIHTVLHDFSDYSKRFVHLFNRQTATVRAVASDLLQELRKGQFRPIALELPIYEKIDINGNSVSLKGKVDRVDAWRSDSGDMYIRVLDYKTGRKKFRPEEVYCGQDLQMLLYLYTLCDHGKKYFRHAVKPAGVMYVPAHSVDSNIKGFFTPEQFQSERLKQLRRSGLILSDSDVIYAMENSDVPKKSDYLPKYRNELDTATGKQFSELKTYISRFLEETSERISEGHMEANPVCSGGTSATCESCVFANACRFDPLRDEPRKAQKIKHDEFWPLVSASINSTSEIQGSNSEVAFQENRGEPELPGSVKTLALAGGIKEGTVNG